MFYFNQFIPEKPSTACLYDIENQYMEWYEDDDVKDNYVIKVKNLFPKR